jgi:hypothetical protein
VADRVGLSGQRISGPSLLDRRVGWYVGCTVQEPSCEPIAGPHRYDTATERYSRGTGPLRVDGFTDAGSRLYETLGCPSAFEVELPGALSAACRIDELAPPAYTATRPRP